MKIRGQGECQIQNDGWYQIWNQFQLQMGQMQESLQNAFISQNQTLQKNTYQLIYPKQLLQVIQMQVQTFIANIERSIRKLKKSNKNILNEFKVEMLQKRKQIQRQSLKNQFDLGSEIFHSIEQVLDQEKTQKIKRNSKSQLSSTNCQSRTIQSNFPYQDDESFGFRGNQKDLRLKGDKQNQDPNRQSEVIRVKTEISFIEDYSDSKKQNPLNGLSKKKQYLNSFDYGQKETEELMALEKDESIQINTEDVKKKYQKFISPSNGWTISGDPKRNTGQFQKFSQDLHPFCTEFGNSINELEEDNEESPGNQTKQHHNSFLKFLPSGQGPLIREQF